VDSLDCYGIEVKQDGTILPVAVADKDQAEEMKKLLVDNNPGTKAADFKILKITITRR
jgi:hypothetical protein